MSMIRKCSNNCVKRPLKNRETKILMTNSTLIKVESIADAPIGTFCSTSDLHLEILCLQLSVFFRVAVLHNIYCTTIRTFRPTHDNVKKSHRTQTVTRGQEDN